MKLVNRIYTSVIGFQLLMLIMFILENINHLDEIDYYIAIGDLSYSFTLNLYIALGVMAIIVGAVILTSITIFGSGMNDEGTKVSRKFISIMILYVLMNIGSSYYLFNIPYVGIVLELLFLLVYILKIITDLGSDKSD